MRTLGDVVEEIFRTGQSQSFTQVEADNFRIEFALEIGDEISRLRDERHKAFSETKNMMLD